MAIDKQIKSLAISILEKNNIDYDDWINEEHKKLIFNNATVLQEAIEKSKKND
ncbi:TPA: hypothetical protein SOL97_003290 [Clostridioides difficile]|nr:hypothetical protein [Clostridioides difficile]